MSELFVLLWVADALKSIQSLNAIVLVCMILFIFMSLIYFATEDRIGDAKKLVSYMKWIFFSVCLVALLPSPTTVRALVAVKVGDYAVHSPLGEKTIKTLETLLDRVVDDKRKGDE